MANTDKEKQLQEQAEEIEKLKKQLADKEAAEQKAAADAEQKAAADAEEKNKAEQMAAEQAAEIERLKALLEEKKAKADTAPETPKTKKILLYKDEKITDDVQVFVNGRQYIIKRGVEVEVPMEVFEVLRNQQRMREHIIAYNAKNASE